MFKKMTAFSCLVLFAVALSGCGADKGQEFLGRWTGENKTRMGKPTYIMDISKDGEIFHVNLETTADLVGYGKMEKNLQRFEAKAESDSVLSIAGGLSTMRLEDKVIYFDGTTYTRLK
ncbi:hypothetical protein ALP73_200074 [Pseudomonas coronafaciens pv. garcae]|uniref:Lipoprotein n=2 Tax=Pseudomonas syringae group TaxID=136849 RepID=A0A1S6YAP1_9PSED|nr:MULTISPECIES: hypothetical protein [Pseudomonas syringae group]KGS11459.1 hypothetical protein OA77_27010 [Pseudomonas coronafaciens]AQX41889.1 hypothetical protein [Pseudomonas coronafaciens pv. garcae]RMN26329.1 hypothetical protein ALQ62_200182 [Pseudomonas coronafaciens pv. zizaniae]RMN88429.1 hypothetical protein ALQ50_200091 [Pseudomonas coronafaciens pv. coronafaciens]RMR95939.1 hypothetical protein ALP74_200499 [Pseudomonas coronafaciens pv. garcae]